MFKKIWLSFKMLKASFKYIKKDPELIFYTILSILTQGIVWIILAVIENFTWFIEYLKNNPDQEFLWFLFVIWYYLVFSFVIFFFNAAIITSVQRRINWEENSFWDGIRDSFKNIWKIFIWSFITSLFSAILNFLQSKFWKNSIIWSIIISIIGWTWKIMTYFSFTIMILENKKVKESISESTSLFTKTWWERTVLFSVNLVLTYFIILITFPLLILILNLVWMDSVKYWNLVIWIIIFYLIFIAFISILASTIKTVLNVILFNYAKTWNLPDMLTQEDISKMFWEKK